MELELVTEEVRTGDGWS